MNASTLSELAANCCEFLVHAVDVEGKQSGVQEELVRLLGAWRASGAPSVPVTYAGGVRSLDDLKAFDAMCGGRVDVTVGSALDLFGGALSYEAVVAWDREQAARAA